MEKTGEEPGVAVIYRSGRTTLCVYRSEFAGTNKGTAAVWEVSDGEGMVKPLLANGGVLVVLDNLPGLGREGLIHFAADFKVAWFKDPDGNILSIQTRHDKV